MEKLTFSCINEASWGHEKSYEEHGNPKLGLDLEIYSHQNLILFSFTNIKINK